MRLNSVHKSAFIKAAMADVPKKDYSEEAKSLIEKAAVNNLPADIKALYLRESTRKYLATHYLQTYNLTTRYGTLRLNYLVNSVNVIGPADSVASFIDEITHDKLEKLIALNTAQQTKLTTLEAKLKSIVGGCSTRKVLLEALPEFEKYLPRDTGTYVDRSVPVVSGVIDEFVSAGWPKKKD